LQDCTRVNFWNEHENKRFFNRRDELIRFVPKSAVFDII
jgi:hypothetical protein